MKPEHEANNVQEEALDQPLDALGQTPLLNSLYTQLSFFFPLTEACDGNRNRIVQILTNGLERLSASFPWTAGHVVNKDGIYKIKTFKSIPQLFVKDLTIEHDSAVPTMEGLRQAKFPFRMLDEGIIAPCKTFAIGDEAAADLPVFLVQVNFIDGGLILTFNAQHGCMDMSGQGQVIYLLSKACRNEGFSAMELSSGNLDRQDLVPLIENYTPGPELEYQLVKQTSEGQLTPPQPPASWAYFDFDATSLSRLKAHATSALPSGYVSTDDTLTAFVWQNVTRARLPRLESIKDHPSTIARAVDVRRHLDLPETYTGLMQNMTYVTYPIQQLTEEPLGHVASQFRRALNADLAYNTRSLVTYLDQADDKESVGITATLELSKDIMLSSWAKEKSYELDFGLGLGRPECVRRPQFPGVESLMYLMPKTLNGDIAVAVCLRDEDMERLKADQEFSKYGMFVG